MFLGRMIHGSLQESEFIRYAGPAWPSKLREACWGGHSHATVWSGELLDFVDGTERLLFLVILGKIGRQGGPVEAVLLVGELVK